MNVETVVAIVSAVVAIDALCLTARQVHQAGLQTKLHANKRSCNTSCSSPHPNRTYG